MKLVAPKVIRLLYPFLFECCNLDVKAWKTEALLVTTNKWYTYIYLSWVQFYLSCNGCSFSQDALLQQNRVRINYMRQLLLICGFTSHAVYQVSRSHLSVTISATLNWSFWNVTSLTKFDFWLCIYLEGERIQHKHLQVLILFHHCECYKVLLRLKEARRILNVPHLCS